MYQPTVSVPGDGARNASEYPPARNNAAMRARLPVGASTVPRAALIAALPTLFVYVVAGKYFVRGLTAGAVKG